MSSLGAPVIRKTENRYTTCLLKKKGNSDKINLLIDKHIFLFCTIVENVWKQEAIQRH